MFYSYYDTLSDEFVCCGISHNFCDSSLSLSVPVLSHKVNVNLQGRTFLSYLCQLTAIEAKRID